jgi:subtilase family serine protease
VDKYYKDFINVDEFESLFALSESELRDKVSKLSKSMKQSVGMKALNLIEEGKLDSIKKIKVLEEVLGYSLIES